jgi:ParB family transcriptional regulator, chromosome partitioning protein
MNLKKRGLGRGLEALLADGANKDNHTHSIVSEVDSERHADSQYQESQHIGMAIGSTNAASDLVANELKKYQSVAENSRKREKQLQELPVANLDVEALSTVVRTLIEDVKRDNLVLLEEAETLLRLFNEFKSIINDQ